MQPSNNDNEMYPSGGAPCTSAFLKTVGLYKNNGAVLCVGNYSSCKVAELGVQRKPLHMISEPTVSASCFVNVLQV